MGQLIALLAALLVIAGLFADLIGAKGRAKIADLLVKWSTGALDAVSPIINAGAAALEPLVGTVAAALRQYGTPIELELKALFAAKAREIIDTTEHQQRALGESNPDNALNRAALAFATAFGQGLASHGVTVAFEALTPEKLNTLNGIGPMFAQMAGFENVAKAVLDPLYANAFGKSLDYHFRSIFKPDFPDEADAANWHSKRLLTEEQLRAIFTVSGLKPEYEEAFVKSKYRALSPFLLLRAADSDSITDQVLRSFLEFGGARPQDVDRMLDVVHDLIVKPYRQSALSAIKTAFERGVRTEAEFDSDLESLKVPAAGRAFVKLETAVRKLQQLDEIYRKSVSEAYKYGTLSDADYVPHLEAIGINHADAEAHYSLDSIAKQGRALQQHEREQARAAAVLQREEINAAIAEYRAGTFDETALLAALVAAGLTPQLGGLAVAINHARRQGQVAIVYGVALPHRDAALLREKVTALEDQVKKQLRSYDSALRELKDLGIDDRDALALTSAWAAEIAKPTKTGELKPL